MILKPAKKLAGLTLLTGLFALLVACSGGSGISGPFEVRRVTVDAPDTSYSNNPQAPPPSGCLEQQSFSFDPIDDATLDRFYITAPVTAGKLCDGRLIGIGSPQGNVAQYSLDGGPWRTDVTDVVAGQRIRLRLRSANTFDTLRQVTLTIGQNECVRVITSACNWILEGGYSEFRVHTRAGSAANAPQVEITYPAAGQILDSAHIRVQGMASDRDGVHEILVNGVNAFSADNFLTWEATIPLRTGVNRVVVSSADRFLNRNPEAATTDIETSRIIFYGASRLAMDPLQRRLYVLDQESNQLISIDLQSEDWEVVSDAGAPAMAFSETRSLVVAADLALAWVLDKAYGDIMQIDLQSGERTFMTESEDALYGARDLVLDSANQQLLMLVTDPGLATNTSIRLGRIIAIDIFSGERKELSSNRNPEGEPEFFLSYSLAFDQANEQLILLQRNNIITIDPHSGQRQLIYGQNALYGRSGTVNAAANSFFVALQGDFSGFTRIFEVDLSTGESHQLRANDIDMAHSGDLVYDRLDNRLIYTSRGHVGVLELDSGEALNWLY